VDDPWHYSEKGRSMKVVSLSSVSKLYNGRRVLCDVSIDIEKGERVVIFGPSGCGKTTILRLIAGFIAPESGSIFIDGELVSRDGKIIKPPEHRNLGMVFQDLALWPHLTVRGNIEFGLKARGVPETQREERIRAILELVGMAEYSDRKQAELSGGQQQRVALARALVIEPEVLLMDEPLSSLDEELNVRLRKEILGLQEKLGFTMIYVTHDRDEAFDIATRIVSMKEGWVEGNREELSENGT